MQSRILIFVFLCFTAILFSCWIPYFNMFKAGSRTMGEIWTVPKPSSPKHKVTNKSDGSEVPEGDHGSTLTSLKPLTMFAKRQGSRYVDDVELDKHHKSTNENIYSAGTYSRDQSMNKTFQELTKPKFITHPNATHNRMYVATTFKPIAQRMKVTSPLLNTITPAQARIKDPLSSARIDSSHTTAPHCINFSFPLIQDLKLGKIKPSPKPRTVYFRTTGRLGNVLFQIAGLYGLYNATGAHIVVTASVGLSKYPFKEFSFFEINQHPPNKSIPTFKLSFQAAEYMQAVRAALKEDIKLMHYFQQLQFFEGCLKTVKGLFKFQDEILNEANVLIRNCVSQRFEDINFYSEARTNITTVGVHVRRGDYMNDYYYSQGYRTPNISYYHRAMDYFRKKYDEVIFIIATNDKQWVKENLSGADIFYSNFTRAADDLALLSQCDHVIQSIGTFSWWAGFLCNGESVYYKDWIANDSHIHKVFKYKPRDRFLPEWIPL